MAEEDVAEAIQLMSSMSQNEIMSVLHAAFRSPAPPVSARAVAGFASQWNSPEVRLERLFWRDPSIREPVNPGIEFYEEVYTHPNTGLKMLKGIPCEPVMRLDEKFKAELEALIKAAVKQGGISKEGDKRSANDAVRSALTRYAVKRQATINGAWESASLTGVFDMKLLFDGEFKRNLVKIGASSLYGGTVGGLSSWIKHPFFCNGIVLGVFIGAAFGTFGLVTTGDWARFGKSLGVTIIGGAASWSGAAAGAFIGSAGGPAGIAICTTAGGILGALAGRQVAQRIPVLGRVTEYEIETMYKDIRKQLSAAGLEPDPSLSPTEVVSAVLGQDNKHGGSPFAVRMTGSMTAGVTQLYDALRSMQDSSPEAFRRVLGLLQAAGK